MSTQHLQPIDGVFGKRIDRIENTKKYIKTYKKIRKGIEIISSLSEPQNDAQHEEVKLAKTYISSERDAFIFSREIVEQVLGNSEYLMIHFAAKYSHGIDGNGKPYNSGTPTIVILGCDKMDESTFRTRTADSGTNPSSSGTNTGGNGSDPGAEQPGGETDAHVHSTNNSIRVSSVTENVENFQPRLQSSHDEYIEFKIK